MKSIAEELQALLNNLHEAEATLAHLKKFEADGGVYRLSLVADHPDWQIKETVDRVARTFVPKTTLLKGLINAAEKEVKDAKSAILDTATAIGMAEEVKLHPGMASPPASAPAPVPSVPVKDMNYRRAG